MSGGWASMAGRAGAGAAIAGLSVAYYAMVRRNVELEREQGPENQLVIPVGGVLELELAKAESDDDDDDDDDDLKSRTSSICIADAFDDYRESLIAHRSSLRHQLLLKESIRSQQIRSRKESDNDVSQTDSECSLPGDLERFSPSTAKLSDGEDLSGLNNVPTRETHFRDLDCKDSVRAKVLRWQNEQQVRSEKCLNEIFVNKNRMMTVCEDSLTTIGHGEESEISVAETEILEASKSLLTPNDPDAAETHIALRALSSKVQKCGHLPNSQGDSNNNNNNNSNGATTDFIPPDSWIAWPFKFFRAKYSAYVMAAIALCCWLFCALITYFSLDFCYTVLGWRKSHAAAVLEYILSSLSSESGPTSSVNNYRPATFSGRSFSWHW